MKSFDEILEERKRKKENGGIDTSRFDAVMSKRVSNKAAELYESFFNEVKGFSSGAETDYNSIDYSNAVSLYDKYSTKSVSLRENAKAIEKFLKENKSYIDSDSYSKMMDGVNTYYGFANDTIRAFGEHKDYYERRPR